MFRRRARHSKALDMLMEAAASAPKFFKRHPGRMLDHCIRFEHTLGPLAFIAAASQMIVFIRNPLSVMVLQQF